MLCWFMPYNNANQNCVCVCVYVCVRACARTRVSGERNGNPLQFSGLENSMDVFLCVCVCVCLENFMDGCVCVCVCVCVCRREQQPTPGFWPGEFHGLYSPWGRKESDTTEWLAHIYTHTYILSPSCLAWRTPWTSGAWWATVHGMAKSWTGLSDWHFLNLQSFP